MRGMGWMMGMAAAVMGHHLARRQMKLRELLVDGLLDALDRTCNALSLGSLN
eukprot:CAMPEP_0174719696 /NCGR_PEP_ID=MMETSP1094-20130205/31780_1 /TAXON_ID=156173 /ORGANISM="Chrysochromulina brevifilum, Strain UTEX LB 985" /LENGTH=51 /DNA_ID=CAMNT_0015920049 /DNA_START=389 /DNA_END=544 /DNA_ORIENTATION=-